ncbi:ROK family transcriptional regulator [Embleya sp. NBC_00896]|uniref:ROK family transcriptional regulator n=1 Tax=Embleya sp. NBC_00896 TaxID=2975961 RepID=UPI002F916258|nr:ROK family transcriptional regulator [Embleya sp. NBC_00896]
MRRQNLALVLRDVAARGPLSRADVAAGTGLTRAAVSSLVEELRAAGLVTEVGAAPSGRPGRPGRALMVGDRGPAGLGLEIGVDHVGACVVDLRGEVRAWVRADAANRDRPAPATLTALARVAARAVRAAAAHELRPAALVLSVPGLVGAVPGTVEHAPNLGWRGEPVAEPLRALLPAGLRALPLTIENEANLGALAELWDDPDATDFVYVSAQAGIGAAVVADGRLFRGARGFAGELGHVPVYPDGPACPCGARGCLEQYAGEAAVLAAAGLADAPDSAACPGDPIALLARHASDGDPAVRAALDRAGSALGTALAGAINLIDPAGVVLGGAVTELGEWLLPAMRRELAARVTVRPWPPEALTASRLGRRAPLLGAAGATIRRIIDDPATFAAGPPRARGGAEQGAPP